MDIKKYKNIIDERYKELNDSEKIILIDNFAKDVFKELGIPEKYYPEIKYSDELNEETPGVFVNKPNLPDIIQKNKILLSESVFLDCHYSKSNSMARMLYRTLHHEGIHCLQKLMRSGVLGKEDIKFNFKATIEDLKALRHKRTLITTESDTGRKTTKLGLSYITSAPQDSHSVLNSLLGRTLYFTQLNEYDAFTQTDNKVIPFLQELCKEYSNEKLDNIKDSIVKHNAYITNKLNNIDDVLTDLGYDSLQEMQQDQATICRAIFLGIKEDKQRMKEIQQEHPLLYTNYLEMCQESFTESMRSVLGQRLNDSDLSQTNDDINLQSKNDNIELISQSNAFKYAEQLKLEELVIQQLGEPPEEETTIDTVIHQNATQQYNNLVNDEEDFELE